MTPSATISRDTFDPQYEFNTRGWGEIPTQPLTEPITHSEWPQELGPVLVISIRQPRMKAFVQRMGPWMKHMRRFPATDGRNINIKQWVSTRKIASRGMTPGQLGCYDSHVRIWEAIAQSPHPVVTVLEDDVDFHYNKARDLLTTWARCFAELKQHHIKWDWLCWGHGPWAVGKNKPLPPLSLWRHPGTCQGFFAYTLTRDMAKKLLARRYPYRGPAVDKWFYDEFVVRNPVNVLCVEPRMCWVVSGQSDTNFRTMK
jgi:GR25 family glycosyltransferase involved in LPS biosynthesis